MMPAIRSAAVCSAFLLGLGVAACNGTSHVGTQSPPPDAGSAVPPPDAGSAAPPPVVEWPAEGLPALGSAGGLAGPWLFFDSLRDDNRDIYAIQPDGSSLRRLTTSPSLERQPAVSPDGKTLAFASDRASPHVYQIFLMPLPGGVIRQLTFRPDGADQPAWSPDGKLIAFHSGAAPTYDHDTIHLIGADGQGERLVAAPPAGLFVSHPTFAPDGQLMCDGYRDAETADLDVMPFGIIRFTGSAKHPSVSADGHIFAYSTSCGGDSRVFLRPLNGFIDNCSEGSPVTALADGLARFPSISSTGLIAFERGTTTNFQNGTPTAHLGLADTALQVTDLTHGESDDHDPSWSPAALVLP